MFWGSNFVESYFCYFMKYSLMLKGMFVFNGCKDRICVIVDVWKMKFVKVVDFFI